VDVLRERDRGSRSVVRVVAAAAELHELDFERRVRARERFLPLVRQREREAIAAHSDSKLRRERHAGRVAPQAFFADFFFAVAVLRAVFFSVFRADTLRGAARFTAAFFGFFRFGRGGGTFA